MQPGGVQDCDGGEDRCWEERYWKHHLEKNGFPVRVQKSELSPNSLTASCTKAFGEVNGQKVSVIDTPGLFDTRVDEKKTIKDLGRCMYYASPGPHVFLVLVPLGRYTEEEKNTVLKLQKVFGEDVSKMSHV